MECMALHWLTAWSCYCSEAVVSQVLDELGIEMADKLTELPSTGQSLAASGQAAKTPQAAGVSDADADLEARLENLRRQ